MPKSLTTTDKMPHQTINKLFESSPLYTSNLYDSKQKSRSHLVLFETITDKYSNDDDNGNNKKKSRSTKKSARQLEHSNAIGYLGRPLSSLSPRQYRQNYDDDHHYKSVNDVYKYHQRTSTPIQRATNPKIQTAASRNESSAVRAALIGVLGKIYPSFSTPQIYYSNNNFDCKNSFHHPFSQQSSSGTIVHHQKYNHRKWPYNQQLQSFSIIMTDEQRLQQQTEQESSQNRVLIKNGKIVNDDAIFKADIYVEDGIIKDVGPHLIVPGGVKTIDANGFFVLPGGIDTHTHMNATFMNAKTADDFYSGTRAALAGGTTTIMDFVLTEKGQSLIESFKKYRSQSDGLACCDYTFRVVIPEFIKGKTDSEMDTLVREHGINSFKLFMAYKDVLMLRDDDLINVLIKCRQLGALPVVHAENGDIIDYNIRKLKNMGITGPEGHLQSRPEEVEAEAVTRITTMANQVNCPVYIVHVNSKSAADAIVEARKRGCLVYGEPIAAGIGSDGTHYFNKCWQHAAGHVMSPPLRPDRSTSEHLINMLASGQLQTIGSDHCVFKTADKARGMKDFSMIPNGVNGVEERLMILWEKAVRPGKLDPRQFVAITSTNAAKIFNLYPRKGRLAKGSDADLVIWGPKPHVIRAENHNSNGDFNIFEGTQVSFGPLVVISNGRVVFDENGLHVVQGSGRFLPCAPNSSFLWHSIRDRERTLPIRIDRDGKDEQQQQQQQPNQQQPTVPRTPPTATVAAAQNGNTPLIPSMVPGTPPQQFPQTIEPPYTKENMGTPNFYKGTTRSGVRNLQDSSFNLSGAQIDDDKIGKTAIRVQNPPGGRSSGIW
ncbi:dihydropyrimidinase-related protein 2-like protein [Dermatophagoides farinae]|uniref:dihydropyrimidinase n=1 Tax=Dermatophagoides farinae TaxID=6954 RepID=A0A9D4NV77_DERFA|nr:dihydropyrimidinase-related protein 2-like protein [Dermatophagoides farinae]